MGELTPEQRGRMAEILAAVRPLAAELYRLTRKPLGVTGEVAEQLVANLLGVTLVEARTAGYDATRLDPGSEPPERAQIEVRAYPTGQDAGQCMDRLTPDMPCDAVLLALPDPAALDVRQVWEAQFSAVVARPVTCREPIAMGGLSAMC